MNLIIKILLFSLLILPLNATKLTLVADIDMAELCEKQSACAKQANLLYSPKNKLLGTFLSFESNKVIDSLIKSYSIKDLSNILIKIETKDTAKFYTYHDFSGKCNKLAPYFLLPQKSNYRLNDTITYYPKQNKQTADMDLSELNAQLNNSQIKRIYLQLTSFSKEEANSFLNKYALIFPIDANTDRWIADLRRMKIYVVE